METAETPLLLQTLVSEIRSLQATQGDSLDASSQIVAKLVMLERSHSRRMVPGVLVGR